MSTTIDFQVILLALIAAIPPTVTAWLAYRKASEAKTLGSTNAATLGQVKEQTDGLARAAEERGFMAGGVDARNVASADLATENKQAAMVEAIVARLLAAQTTQLTPVLMPQTDPGPVAARQLGDIKTVVDDVQPRVVAIEEATTSRGAAVERVAASADDRLTKLEEKKE